jgi:hypothetical protein
MFLGSHYTYIQSLVMHTFLLFSSTAENRVTLNLEVTDEVFVKVYNYLKFRESYGTLTKGEVRTLYHTLFRKSVVQRRATQTSRSVM